MHTDAYLHWTDLGRQLSVPTPSPPPSVEEFSRRRDRVREYLLSHDLDALLTLGNESEFSSLRYLTNYWPLFESGGVLITPNPEDDVLLIGPESETYARDRSTVSRVRMLGAFRESADPSYPEVPLDTFPSVLKAAGLKDSSTLGIAGTFAANYEIISELTSAYPRLRLRRANDAVEGLREIKSASEVANLRRAFEISEIALKAVLERIRPGLTELQVVGIALAAMYANGAEFEGMPQYVLSGPNSKHAIGRPGNRVLERGDIVQLNISARVSGYSSGIGRPVSLGPLRGKKREIVEFCREAHYATREWLKPGVPAAQIARQYRELFRDRGFDDAFLYGPCTGLGMMETEKPWVESTSDYIVAEGMTFQIDTFAEGPDFGARWENGAVVVPGGIELFSDSDMDLIEIS